MTKPFVIRTSIKKITKGYYESESALVEGVKRKVGSSIKPENFKTIECQIMDIADDIAYSTYDFEDALKSGFLSPLDMMNSSPELLRKISEKIRGNSSLECSEDDIIKVLFSLFRNIFAAPSKPEATIASDKAGTPLNPVSDPFTRSRIATRIYKASLELSQDGNLRTQLTSALVGEFIKGVEVSVDETNPVFSRVSLKDDVLFKVEVLKHFSYEAIIMSPKLKVAEYRGNDIVTEIFQKLAAEESKGISLLPDDCQALYNVARNPSSSARLAPLKTCASHPHGNNLSNRKDFCCFLRLKRNTAAQQQRWPNNAINSSHQSLMMSCLFTLL